MLGICPHHFELGRSAAEAAQGAGQHKGHEGKAGEENGDIAKASDIKFANLYQQKIGDEPIQQTSRDVERGRR